MKLADGLHHPLTTVAGLLVTVGSAAGILATTASSVQSIAAIPGAPARVIEAAQHTEMFLSVTIGIGAVFAALGKSLLTIGAAPVIDPPPGIPVIPPAKEAA